MSKKRPFEFSDATSQPNRDLLSRRTLMIMYNGGKDGRSGRDSLMNPSSFGAWLLQTSLTGRPENL